MPEHSPALQTASGNELLLFLADLGAALSAIGETVDAIEQRLALIARAYGLEDARFSVFPTSLFLTLGRGEAATIEPTKRLSATPRLDQIAAVHRLAEEAERGAIAPAAGIAQLEEIRATGSRYGPLASVLGYTTLTIGIALILRPAPRDVAAAAVLGTVVGVLRLLARGRRSLEVLMPFLAAFAVALLTALAVKYEVTDPGLRAMIAALVVFIPGVALTTAVLELTEGQMISGSSRLVWATTQLGLIAFGIVAGVSAAGVPAERAFSSSDALLGDWAPWLGVLVFAVGVTVAHSTPPGALLSLLVVLYAAWTGQVLGDALFGAYSSGFVGAVVMTFVAYQLARLQSTMPVYAMFLPGFWLLVPGSLGLIGLTTFLAFPDSASGADVFAVIGAIAAVALGVLCGVELHRWLLGAERRAQAVKRRVQAARCLSAPRASSTACTRRQPSSDAPRKHESQTETGDAPITARASSQFSRAVQKITSPLPRTPITPTHEPSIRIQSSASAAMITASQPLFGPCVPSSLTGPSATHVTNTPTRTAATATRLASRHVAARSRRALRVAHG